MASTLRHTGNAASSSETPKDRAQRLVREAKEIAEARHSVATEGTIPIAEIRLWADSLGTDHELPLPAPKSR